jgi:HK97 gp10 family phage protein
MGLKARVKMNHVPQVREAIPRDMGKALEDFGDDLVTVIQDRIWIDTGVAERTVEWRDKPGGGEWAIEVVVGWYLGKGFYVGFHEFGTSHLAARPVVRPAAHESEPIFASYCERALKRACEA